MKYNFNTLVMSLIMVLAFTLLSSNIVLAQENSIYRLYDGETNTGSHQRASSNINVPENLLHGKNPTVYVKNSSIINVTGEESPKVLKLLDAASYNILENSNSIYSDVEVITITLERASDLNNRLDVYRLNGFNSLRYIYVKCLFECNERQISSFLLNAENITTIFYKVVNPS